MSDETLFHAALAKPPGERAAFLDQACVGQPALRAAVEALLAAHAASAPMLDRPAVDPDATGAYTPVDQPPSANPRLAPGVLFAGRFKLREKLGEGGMGSVWVADQTEPVQRRVALKVIKAGQDSERLLARFEQERQALALMDHPHIAKVFDAGVAAGAPYFVMELIKGLPLTKYCDEAKLTPRERLDLFVPVCQAVQHAHQKGIIHRDLKPSNIIVGLYDGKPVPKVIDFGVAKATGPQLTEQSIYTEVGALIGTLEYMSPEQAELNNLDIDTRTDIYALGVILYELLTGSLPFSRKELQAAAFTEMLRIIKEVEPPRPSTKISTSEKLPSLAAVRRTEPKKLSALVKGDLDWIVMKCLEKERRRRYDTANGLALDIQRYLADEPIQAGPPTLGYRLRKYVRRHRGQVIAASLFLLALLGGLAGTTFGLFEAQRQRDDAEAAQQNEAQQRTLALRERDDKEKARAAEAAERAIAVTERQKAVTERDARQREALRADGLRLAAEARVAVRTDPALALRLAAEATRRHAHFLTFGAFHEALGELREERELFQAKQPEHGFRFVRYSADGRQLWVVRYGNPAFQRNQNHVAVVTILDAETRQPLRTWRGVPNMLLDQFDGSPDGKWLAASFSGFKVLQFTDGLEPKASAFTGHAVHLVDAATGKGVRNLGRHDDGISSVRFSPDSRRLVTASADTTARVWEVATGKELCRIKGHTKSLLSAAFSPDGRHILTITSSEDQRTSNVAAMASGMVKLLIGNKDAGVFSNIFDELSKQKMASGWFMKDPRGKLIPVDPVVTDRPAVVEMLLSASSSFQTGADTKLAGLWDAASGKPLAVYTKTRRGTSPASHVWKPTCGGFTRDGTKVVIAFANGTVGLWEAAAGGDEKVACVGHEGEVNSVTFSPDNTRIATAGEDQTVRIWDTLTGKELSRIRVDQAVNTLKFDRAGQRLLGRCFTSVYIWDVTTGTPLAHLRGNGPFTDATFTPEETQVVTAGFHSASLWSLRTLPGPERVVTAHRAPLTAFTYSPNGAQLLTASVDGTVKLIDPVSGQLRHTLGTELKHGKIQSASFSPDGKLIVTASEMKELKEGMNLSSIHVWDAATGTHLFQFDNQGIGAAYAVFVSDGQQLLTVSDGRRTKRGFPSYSVSSSKDAGLIQFWDAATRKLLHTFPVRADNKPSLTRDGRLLFLRPKFEGGGVDLQKHCGVCVYDSRTGLELRKFGAGEAETVGPRKVYIEPSMGISTSEIVVSPDGRHVVSSREPALWDSMTGKLVTMLDKWYEIRVVAFSPDSKRLAIVDNNKGYILNAETGATEVTLVGHGGVIEAVAFSPDGTQVVTGSADKTAARWRADTGKLEAVYMGHKEAVEYVAFRPDGQQIATATKNGEVRLWPLDPVAEILRRAPRDLTDDERQRYEVPALVGPPRP